MCLLAILHRAVEGAPLLVAANREEFFDRPFLPPHVQGTRTRFLAGVDVRAGGTWLGVNERGMVAAVTNRPKIALPDRPRSRGLLCRELLDQPSVGAAREFIRQELIMGAYAGANFVVADRDDGFLVEAGDELSISSLVPGLHLVTNGPADSPQDPRQDLAREMFAAAAPYDVPSFLVVARRVCSQGPDASGRSIVLRRPERGTVSSTLLALPLDPQQAVCEFAAGSPDVTPYEDYSRLLRQMLVAE